MEEGTFWAKWSKNCIKITKCPYPSSPTRITFLKDAAGLKDFVVFKNVRAKDKERNNNYIANELLS